MARRITPPSPGAAAMPLRTFAAEVLRIARSAERYRDSARVWIIDVFLRFIRTTPMTIDAFKGRLVEANQQRLVTLARVDLPQALTATERAKEVASETRQLNATFHWIRLT